MTENVDGYEISWTADTVIFRFTDVFNEGTDYTFPATEAWKIRHDLTVALNQITDRPVAVDDRLRTRIYRLAQAGCGATSAELWQALKEAER